MVHRRRSAFGRDGQVFQVPAHRALHHDAGHGAYPGLQPVGDVVLGSDLAAVGDHRAVAGPPERIAVPEARMPGPAVPALQRGLGVEAEAPAVTRALVAAGAEVLSVNPSRHSLEDVYLELVDQVEEAGQG
jgi:hypothetical protein